MEEVDRLELRHLWRLSWLDSIEEFSNAEAQAARWGVDPSPHYSYIEYCCCYFDDLALNDKADGYVEALQTGLVSNAEVEAVDLFHQSLCQYQPPTTIWDNDGILADPDWQNVIAKAAQAKVALLAIITDDIERWHLTQP